MTDDYEAMVQAGARVLAKREFGQHYDGYEQSHAQMARAVIDASRFIRSLDTEVVAKWMMANSYATGHGDDVASLIAELDWQHQRRMLRLVELEGWVGVAPDEALPDFIKRINRDMSRWNPARTAPIDGTRLLVTDGEYIWISARKYSDKSKDGMPIDGYDWITTHDGRQPRWWLPLPAIPKVGST